MKQWFSIAALSLVACSHTVDKRPAEPSLEAYFEEHAAAKENVPAEAPTFEGGLESYVEFALRTHPELEANYHAWQAATHRPDAAWDWPNPRLTYGLFIQHVETRVGPQRHRFGLMQPIPWPSKLSARRDAAGVDTRVEEERYSAAMLDVRRRIANVYWSKWAVERKLRIQKEQIQIAETLARSARGRVEMGRASLADLNQIELTLSRMRDDLAQLEEDRRALDATMAAALGMDEVREFPILTDAPTTAGVDPTEIEAWTARLESHPALETIVALRQKKELQASSSSVSAYPDFAIGVDYIETGEAMNPAVDESGKDPVIAMVTVELPIFSGAESSQAEAYQAEARSLRSKRRAMRQQMLAELRVLASALDETHRRVDFYAKTLIPQAKASYTSVRSAYEVGQNQVAAILLAQRDLVELERSLVEARAAHAKARTDIEALTAAPIERSR